MARKHRIHDSEEEGVSDHYTYRVTWSPEDQEHAGLCAEFPSLSWLAASPDEALDGIRKLVAEVLEDMAAAGEHRPPRSRTASTAAGSSRVCRRRCIGRWRWRQPRKASA